MSQRRRPARTFGGVIGVIVIICLKLFALAEVSRLLRGDSPVVIFVTVIVVAIVFRYLTRFIGRR